MAITKSYNFQTTGNYLYDTSKIIVNPLDSSPLIPNPGQTFTQDFANDTGFTYNASNTEFTGGVVRQIQKSYRPTYYDGKFFADFNTSIDGSYGFGSLTGNTVGAPVLSGGKLQCLGGGNNAVYWNNAGISEISRFLSIKLKYTPNYNVAPAANSNIAVLKPAAGNANRVVLFHGITGTIRFTLYNNAGGAHVIASSFATGFNPVSGTEYEILFCVDSVAGRAYGFVDGNLIGNNNIGAFTRTSGASILQVGAGDTYSSADGTFDHVGLYSYVLNTVSYVPSAYGTDVPYQPTFYASYNEDLDGNWGNGVLTGTPVGGASISGSKLDLRYSDVRYATYPAANNGNSGSRGCIRMKYTPNYSGIPPADRAIISESNGVSLNDCLLILHQSTGNLWFRVYQGGAAIVNVSQAWLPVAGTEYELEFNWDMLSGASRMFVDGVQLGATSTGTGVRATTMTLIKVGGSFNDSLNSNAEIDDVVFFAHPQHISNYTPDWTTLRPYEYDNDVVTLPTFTYSGVGSVQSFDTFVVTEANSPRYIINGEYWTGAAWAASSDTWATASPSADVVANISTLTASDTLIVKAVTQNNIGSQQSVDDLTVTYTGQAAGGTTGTGALLLYNNATTFNQPFTNDTGFTYNASLAEFTSGKVQQIDLRPTNATFFASYSSDIDGDWGYGTLTGTGYNSPTIGANGLDLTFGDVRYVDYVATSNAGARYRGAIRFEVTPNYNGTPATPQVFVVEGKEQNSLANYIIIYQHDDGNIHVQIRDNNALQVVDAALGVWVPVLGTTYEFELNYDLASGATRLFIDGTQFGVTQTDKGTRTSDITLLRVGSNVYGTTTSNFEIANVICFSSVQHTSNYVPAAAPYSYIYSTSTVQLPAMTYPGAGTMQALTGFTATESGAPKYIINSQYWTGAAWAASAGTYAQANTAAEVHTNISTITMTDPMNVTVVFPDSNTQSYVDVLDLAYTGQTYSPTAIKLRPNGMTRVSGITSISAITEETGSDTITYTFEINGTEYYWNGTTWATTTGYPNTNTVTEINTNLVSLNISPNSNSRLVMYLYSSTGGTTPKIGDVTVVYDDTPGSSTVPNECLVSGRFINGAGNPISGVVVRATPTAQASYDGYIISTSTVTTTSDSAGYWELSLVENANMTPSTTKWSFTFSGAGVTGGGTKTVPDQASSDYNDLT